MRRTISISPLLFFWLFCLLSFEAGAQRLPIGVERFDESNGFPSKQIFEILADTADVLWISTDRGLCTFDGGTPLRVDVDARRAIVNMVRDSVNRIWLFDIEGCLGYIKGGKFSPHPLAKDGEVYPIGPSLYSGENGRLWVYPKFGNRIILFDEQEILKELKVFSKSKGEQRSYAKIENGRAGQLLVLGPSNITSVRKGKVEFTAPARRYSNSKRNALLLRNGRLIIQYGNTLFELVDTLLIPMTAVNEQLKRNSWINSILQAKDGKIWFATPTELMVTDEHFNIIDISQHKFSSGSFNCLFEDVEGNVWAGTNDDGLYKIEPDRFFYEDYFLLENRISTITNTQGYVYVGSFDGKLYRFEGREKTLLLSYPGYRIHRIAVNKKGEVLVSFLGGVTILLHNRERQLKFDLPIGFASRMTQRQLFWVNDQLYSKWLELTVGAVKSLTVIDEQFYAASSRGIAWLEFGDTDSIHLRYDNAGTRNWSIAPFPFDEDSVLIIKTDGLHGWDRQSLQQKMVLEGRWKRLGWSADSSLWLATGEDGLHHFTKDSVYRLVSPLDKNDVYINDMAINKNHIGIATNNGVTIIDLSGEGPQFDYLREETLPDGVMRSVAVTDSLVYCGGDQGLVIYQMGVNGVPDSTRNRRITKVVIDQENMELSDRYVLRSDKNKFQISHSVLRYSRREEVNYQYFLHGGMNEQWTDIGQEVFFEGLKPGKYTFEVRSKLSGGPWSSDNPKVEIELVPYFYERTFFWILVAVLMMSLIGKLILDSQKRIAANDRAKAKMNQKVAAFEMKAVQAQMNPHFISNALTSIQYFVLSNDSETANKYLSQFSRLIRLVLDSTRSDKVLLKDELSMHRLYLNLEVLRIRNLSYEINVDPEIEQDELLIPSLLTQPFIENSVKHAYREGGDPVVIKLSYVLHGETLKVTIQDNGQGMAQAAERDESERARRSYGMKLIQEKIEILKSIYGQHVDIDITDLATLGVEQKGTKVEISITLED